MNILWGIIIYLQQQKINITIIIENKVSLNLTPDHNLYDYLLFVKGVKTMMTGELKTKIENIWDIFWSSGITNPLTIVEQITYLLFIKIIDDNEIKKEANAAIFDMEVVDPTFDAEHQNCRWHNFRHYEANAMFLNMTDHVFPFIKAGISGGRASAELH